MVDSVARKQGSSLAERLTVCVLGTGAGSLSVYAETQRAGHEVRLFSRRPDRVAALTEIGEVETTGPAGFGRVPTVGLTTSLEVAVRGADVVVVAAPGDVQEWYLERLQSLLSEDQLLLLTPGSGGALVARARRLRHDSSKYWIAETVTLPYVVRSLGPATVHLEMLLRPIYATLPAGASQKTTPLIEAMFRRDGQRPMVMRDVVATTLSNPNPVVHALPCLLNLGWIERRQGELSLYVEGMTESVLAGVERTDHERLLIAESFGLSLPTIDETYEILGTSPFYRLPDVYASFHPAFQRVEPRYLSEDFGVGLFSIVALGRTSGVATPLLEAVLQVFAATRSGAEVVNRRDQAAMGIEGLTVDRVNTIVQ